MRSVVSLNLLILLALMSWGLGGVFDKKALFKAKPFDALLMTYISFIPIAALAALVLNVASPGWDPPGMVLVWTGLAAFVNGLGLTAYLVAMEHSEASYVLGITAAYPIVMQVIAVAVLGEHLIAMRVAGSILIAAGVFVIGFSKNEQQAALSNKGGRALTLWLVLAMLGWGLTGIFDKLAVLNAAPLVVYVSGLIWNACLAFLIYCARRLLGHVPKLKPPSSWQFPALSCLCMVCGSFGYIAALSVATASYVIVITGCYPLLMYLFALIILHERFNKIRLVGIIVIVLGAVLTQLTQLS